jgi:hypothetical protein
MVLLAFFAIAIFFDFDTEAHDEPVPPAFQQSRAASASSSRYVRQV